MAAVMSPPRDFSTPSSTPEKPLSINTSVRGTPTAIPNKHIPYCSPGPRPDHGLLSPPASPPSASATNPQGSSLLYPPTAHCRKISSSSEVYAISAATLSEALNHISTQPLADPKLVFPWLHGLHPENHFQLTFFDVHRQASRRVPKSLRSICIVKAGNTTATSKLKGAITADELLSSLEACKTRKHSEHCEGGPCFLDIDPKMGFGVRNFQIQACKMATVSDIIVYGDEDTPRADVEALAGLLARAQKTWSSRADAGGEKGKFNTFLLMDDFAFITKNHPELVAIDKAGVLNNNIMDFCRQERIEMCSLSEASEIATNVWLGPSPDPMVTESLRIVTKGIKFDVLIETTDYAQLPDVQALNSVERYLSTKRGKSTTGQMMFPSSGSIAAGDHDGEALDGLLQMCRWIHKLANGIDDGSMTTTRRFFIHCADGYTETTLLAIAYIMFSQRLSAHDAWIRLHRDKNRNFFAYSADKTLLERFQIKLTQLVPDYAGPGMLIADQPIWMKRMDGSLPSRVLPYLYLGNLMHANNPGLLKELGIKRVLSVGEPISWNQDPTIAGEDPKDWPKTNFLYIDRVQDNGLDPLTCEFERCLKFIEEGKRDGIATLVHCRVGVSRSATICIAEVMNELGLSFPRAYCYVRARRLNVIIQPHLRFAYELLKWEEFQAEKRGVPYRRDFEWATIAREIALMNKPYCR